MFADIQGCNTYYTSYGEGPPVVFVHGLGGCASIWHGVMQAMQQHHNVIALDLRGHGRSAGKGKFSVEGWANDLRGLIRHLELPAATLVGHSLGSLVVQQVAQNDPELCDYLVLAGGISYFHPETTDALRDRAEKAEKEGLDEIADEWLEGAVSPQTHATMPGAAGLLREMYVRNEPAMYAKSCRALAKAPNIARNDIGQPTLVLVGAHDRSTPLAMAEELKRDIPVSRVNVVPDVAHWMPVEDPGTIAARILEFLT